MTFAKLALFIIFFLVFIPIALAQKGLLKTEVKDCSTGLAIADAEVDVQLDGIGIEFTNSEGIAYFILSPGTFNITVSKSGYSTKNGSATVYSDQITKKEFCLERIEICKISASIEYTVIDKNVTSTITLTNDGSTGEYVNVWMYACNETCASVCSRRVYVSAYDTYVLKCETELKNGSYNIKVVYSFCGKSSTIYSDKFYVPAKCEEKYLDVFRCYGNYRQRLYQHSNCSTSWYNLEFCAYGCENGMCLPKSIARLGEPVVILNKTYYGKACEASIITFEIKNKGDDGKFDIEVSGPASQWIKVISPISIAKEERKTIVGYASLPCDAKGEYQFTIEAKDKTSDFATATIKAKEEVRDVGRVAWNIVGIFVAGAIVIIIIRYFKGYLLPRKKEEVFAKVFTNTN